MRALRIISIAFITAVAGLFLGAIAGDYITRMLHVSEMEGGRGMMVVFVCAPLGAMVGGIVGLIVAILMKRPGWGGFLSALGLAVLIVGAIAGFLCGILYLGSDKPPKIDGRNLTLDFELRIPASVKIPEQPDGYFIRVSLYESNRQNRYGFIDWNSIVRGPDQTTISGTADLLTHSSNRSLLASVGNEPIGSQFFDVKIPSVPRKEDENWSDWIAATQRADLTPVPETERFSIRYRVRKLE
jgi:MFS family permease